MAKINLKVDKAVYQSTINTLSSYVGQLQNKIGEYQGLRNRIDNIWSDTEADKYKETLDEMVKKVQATISATNKQIEALRDILTKKEEEELDVTQVVQDAVDVVFSLF